MNHIISPSILNADLGNLEKVVLMINNKYNSQYVIKYNSDFYMLTDKSMQHLSPLFIFLLVVFDVQNVQIVEKIVYMDRSFE